MMTEFLINLNKKEVSMIKFLMLSLLITGMARAETPDEFKVLDYSRHLELIGVVQDNALELANKINVMSLQSNKEITMLINSPGGNVNTGMIMIDSMRQAKARGVHFRCLSTVLSASMAYIILAECDERAAFGNTLLLWHEISLSLKSAKVRDLYNTLPSILELQERVDTDLKGFMNVSDEFYQKHSKSETMWTASELVKNLNNDFIKIISRADFKTVNLFTFMNNDIAFGEVSAIVQRVIDRMTGLD